MLTLPDGTVLTFRLHRGLYLHRVGDGPDDDFVKSRALAPAAQEILEGHAFSGIPVMTTEGLTPRQIRGGERARILQQRLAFSSDRDMATMVRTNPINNLSIDTADLAAAL